MSKNITAPFDGRVEFNKGIFGRWFTIRGLEPPPDYIFLGREKGYIFERILRS
jgi:hypothetical protein